MCKVTIGCCHGNECQNSQTGWFLIMVGPINSIVQLLVLRSKKSWVCNKLSDCCNSGWKTAFERFRPTIRVNNSLYWSHWPEYPCACCFFLALRLTTALLDLCCCCGKLTICGNLMSDIGTGIFS